MIQSRSLIAFVIDEKVISRAEATIDLAGNSYTQILKPFAQANSTGGTIKQVLTCISDRSYDTFNSFFPTRISSNG